MHSRNNAFELKVTNSNFKLESIRGTKSIPTEIVKINFMCLESLLALPTVKSNSSEVDRVFCFVLIVVLFLFCDD